MDALKNTRIDVKSVIAAAEMVGDAVAVFDAKDRLLFANKFHRELLPFIDFDRGKTFERIFWTCLEHRNFAEPEVYRDPDEWLKITNERRRAHRSLQFVRKHSDGRSHLVRIRTLPDLGSIQVRSELPPEISASGMPDLAPLGAGGIAAGGDPDTGPLQYATEVTSILNCLPNPAAVVSAKGHICALNRPMERILERQDGLGTMSGRLRAADPRLDATLQRTIARYGDTNADEAQSLLRLPRTGSDTSYLLRVSSWPRPAGAAGARGAALVTVFDPDRRMPISAGLLVDIYGLTTAEAEIAVMLAEGRSTGDIALRRGASKKTVRLQLSAIFAKTNCAGQADLVRLLTNVASLMASR